MHQNLLGIAFALCTLGLFVSLSGCEHSGTAAKERESQPVAPATITSATPAETAATTAESGKSPPEADAATETASEVVVADTVATTPAVDAFGNPVVPAAKPLPGGVKVLVPEKEFTVEGPDDALRVSYDDIDLLKVINMEPVTADAPQYFPDWLKNLEGKRVRIRGFMYPEFEPTGLEMFSMARDTQICCFGRDPKVYDVFRVILRDGVTTDYIELKPFEVVGVFHIDPVELGG
ncbi:MAG: hypothetical protein WD065_21970, partial [Planctomycetaceae bacterium]